MIEAIKKGISFEDPIEVFNKNCFIVEKELGVKITPDFPIIKLMWYFDMLNEYYSKNGSN